VIAVKNSMHDHLHKILFYISTYKVIIMSALQTLTPREAYAAYITGSILVDVRDPLATQQKSADVKSIVHIPFDELDNRLPELPTNRQVVFVSRVGVKGKEAARKLFAQGHPNVAMVEGGLDAWEQEGLPVR
jgi:rhodanese-related sulfurtransferase